jgi:hypothetical protein
MNVDKLATIEFGLPAGFEAKFQAHLHGRRLRPVRV